MERDRDSELFPSFVVVIVLRFVSHTYSMGIRIRKRFNWISICALCVYVADYVPHARVLLCVNIFISNVWLDHSHRAHIHKHRPTDHCWLLFYVQLNQFHFIARHQMLQLHEPHIFQRNTQQWFVWSVLYRCGRPCAVLRVRVFLRSVWWCKLHSIRGKCFHLYEIWCSPICGKYATVI